MICKSKTKANKGLGSSKFLTLVIVFSPIIGQYASRIPGVNIADILLGISCILVLLFSGGFNLSLKKTKPLILFWLFGTFISLISFFVQQELGVDIITRFVRFSFYIFVIIISANNFDKNIALKMYKILCVIISIYIILQVTIYHSTGIILPFKVFPMPWANGRIFDVNEAISWATRWYFRPTGVFVEPGYAAQFLLPGLVFSLYGWMKNQESKAIDVKSTVLIFIALVLTTSSQGIFIAMIILGLYSISFIRKSKGNMKIVKCLLMIIISIVFIKVFMNLDVVEKSLDKVIGSSTGGGSTALRVFRGFEVFIQLPLLYKVIGVGHGNLGDFVLNSGIVTKYDPPVMTQISADYASGISLALLYYGIIGIVLLGWFYWSLWKNTKNQFRLVATILIILSFVSGSLIDITSIFYVSFIYAGYENYKKKV